MAHSLSTDTFPLTVLFFNLTTFVFYKLCHDAHKYIFPQHEFCLQYIVVVFPVFLRGTFSMDTVQTLRIQFPPAAFQLGSIHNHLPVLSPYTGAFKHTAPQQTAHQAADYPLQLTGVQPLKIVIYRLPVGQLRELRPSTQLSDIFDHGIRIEFLACFSHAADIKYRGEDACHQ